MVPAGKPSSYSRSFWKSSETVAYETAAVRGANQESHSRVSTGVAGNGASEDTGFQSPHGARAGARLAAACAGLGARPSGRRMRLWPAPGAGCGSRSHQAALLTACHARAQQT